jgi:hypothetical protein
VKKGLQDTRAKVCEEGGDLVLTSVSALKAAYRGVKVLSGGIVRVPSRTTPGTFFDANPGAGSCLCWKGKQKILCLHLLVAYAVASVPPAPFAPNAGEAVRKLMSWVAYGEESPAESNPDFFASTMLGPDDAFEDSAPPSPLPETLALLA